MLDKFKKTLQEAASTLREQAASLGEGAKEKSYEVINEWLLIFPKLESIGLEITSFCLSVGLSPALEVEMKGKHADFTPGRLQQIIEENQRNAAMVSVMTTIKSTYSLHRKIYANLREPLIVKVRIKISPEIKVFIGEPIIQ